MKITSEDFKDHRNITEDFVQDYREYGARHTARAYGISVNRARHLICKYGRSRKYHRLTAEEISRIRSMYDCCVPIEQIKRQCKICSKTLYRYVGKSRYRGYWRNNV